VSGQSFRAHVFFSSLGGIRQIDFPDVPDWIALSSLPFLLSKHSSMIMNIPVNAPQQRTQKHCPMRTSREAHTAVAVVGEMALIVDHVLPNAANDTFRTSRSFDDFVASFPLCLRSLRRPAVLLLTCSYKV